MRGDKWQRDIQSKKKLTMQRRESKTKQHKNHHKQGVIADDPEW